MRATDASNNPWDTIHFIVILLVIMDFSYYENVLTDSNKVSWEKIAFFKFPHITSSVTTSQGFQENMTVSNDMSLVDMERGKKNLP